MMGGRTEAVSPGDKRGEENTHLNGEALTVQFSILASKLHFFICQNPRLGKKMSLYWAWNFNPTKNPVIAFDVPFVFVFWLWEKY